MAGTGNLMKLKDLLELDGDSCSAAGFRCYPRRLGDGESSPTPPLGFCRSPSSSSSSLRRSSKLSRITRSLSRRLTGNFCRWRRRSNDDEGEVNAPAVRGCGSEQDASPASECSDSSAGRTTRSRSESGSYFSSASSASENMHAAVDTAGDEHEDEMMKKRGPAREEGCISGSEAEDKEQLSPVAVMDFPCFDDHCSPSSYDSLLSRLQGRKTHTIRRFPSLDELRPVNLEARLAACQNTADDQDDVVPELQLQRHAEETTRPRATSSCLHGAGVHDETEANGLLVLLVDTVPAGVDAVSERLLLDFFVEMKMERRRSERAGLSAPAGLLRRMAERSGDGEILAAARGRLLDGGGWGLEDVLRGGEAVRVEMERGRRWMQVGGEEEREVGTVVAGLLTDQLVDEMVRDLLV